MWDCAIIGGGPAGLTAATYLGRFKRDVVVIDAGESRTKRIPLTRNVPGFPDGIKGSELLSRMQEQAARYGALFRAGQVDTVVKRDVCFRITFGRDELDARTVLLATGAKLVEPDIPNLDQALAQGLIRYCPICDGYEAEGQNIAVLGARPGGIAEAHFLRTFSERVSYFWQGDGAPSAEERDHAVKVGIQVAETPAGSVTIKDRVQIQTGAEREAFDVLYPCLGCGPKSDLALAVGADVAPEGGVQVNAHQMTRIEGFYAAGDVLQGLDQIASACGQAAIAAVAMHNQLRNSKDGGVTNAG